MKTELGEWWGVTEVRVCPRDEDDEGPPYVVTLRWDLDGRPSDDTRKVKLGPVDYLTLATGATVLQGGEVEWRDPEGAPAILYTQPDQGVGLVVGDLDAAPTMRNPLDDRGEESEGE